MPPRKSLPRRSGKKLKLAKSPASSNLYADDYKEVASICDAEGVKTAVVLREIVHDWLRIKRLQALSLDEVESPVRSMYERTLQDQLKPLTETVRQLRGMIEEQARAASPQLSLLPSATASPSPVAPSDLAAVLSALAGIKSLVEETGRNLAEAGAEQINQINLVQVSQMAVQSVVNEAFATNWMTADLIIRYLVEVHMHESESSNDEVDRQVAVERTGLRLEALGKVAGIEEFLQLPPDLRLADILAKTGGYPLNLNGNGASAGLPPGM